MNRKSGLRERMRTGWLRTLPPKERWALVDQAVVSGANFLTSAMLARFMGLREFGVFVLAWMAVVFAGSLQNALIVAPMMSIGPKQKAQDRPSYFGALVLQEALFAMACFAAVWTALLASVHFARQSGLRQLAFPLAAAALAYPMQDFVRRCFFATGAGRRAVADDALSYLTQLPILFLMHRSGVLNSETALWAMAGTSMAGCAAGWFWMERVEFNWLTIKAVWKRHWHTSRWLTGSAVLTWTSSNLFVLAAPVYYGASAAGVLKASQNLMGVTHVWFQGLDNVVPVEAARRLGADGVPAMLGYIRATLARWGGLTLIFAAVMAAAPGFWLRLVYGQQMSQYGSVLRLYALLYVVVFLGGPLRAGLQALEFTAPIFWSYLAMTAFAFAFAVPLAKWMGLNGTMLGLIAAQVLFQGIVGVALLAKAGRSADRTGPRPHAAEC